MELTNLIYICIVLLVLLMIVCLIGFKDKLKFLIGK